MGPPVLAEWTSCRWRASWLESSSHLPALSASQGYGLQSYSTVTHPGDRQNYYVPHFQWQDLNAGADLCYNARFFPSRVEFSFTTYLNGTELVSAVQNLNYKGGNTRTGAGLKYVSDNFFNPASSREVPKVWWCFINKKNCLMFNVALLVFFNSIHGSFLTPRSPSWSQTGSRRTVCRSQRRSCAVKECMFLQLVGVWAAGSPLVFGIIWIVKWCPYEPLWFFCVTLPFFVCF